MFEFELDGDVYALHLAGKVAGRGTTATADNETSFLLVLSARQHGAKDDEESIKIKMIDSKVYSKVDGVTDKNAMSLVKYLEDNPSWMLSHRKQVNVLMQKIGTKIPKRYVKDDSKLEINKQFEKKSIQMSEKMIADKLRKENKVTDTTLEKLFGTTKDITDAGYITASYYQQLLAQKDEGAGDPFTIFVTAEKEKEAEKDKIIKKYQ